MIIHRVRPKPFSSVFELLNLSEVVLAVGSSNIPGKLRTHNKAETFSHSKSSWKMRAEYPYHNGTDHNGLAVNGIFHHKMLSFGKDFIVFGGFHYANTVKDLRFHTQNQEKN